MKPHSLPLFVILPGIYAQGTGEDNDNPSVDIQSCGDLSCINSSSRGVCQIGQQRAVGVGIAGEVISAANTPLSLTLVDGDASGVIGDSRGYQFSTQTLYVGIPQALDAQDQPTGCALMAQYQGSTFPDIDSDMTSNTTGCGTIIPESCRKNLADMIQGFKFNSTSQSGGRCDALTQFVSTNIRRQLTFCNSWLAGFTNITGGAILGPGAASEVTQLQQDGCQPVLPEQGSLYKVAEMTQLLYAGEEDILQPEGDSDDQRPLMGAGRSGITPVVTVLWDESGSQSPDVQFACMRTFGADGGDLPDTLNYESSAEMRLTAQWSVLAAAVCGLLYAV